MELCIGISLVILSTGISVFLTGIVGYNICIHRKKIEVAPSQDNFNPNNPEEKV